MMDFLFTIAEYCTSILFPIRPVLYLAGAMVIQGYLEDERAKIHSGVIMLTALSSIDKSGIYGPRFAKVMFELYEVYKLTPEQIVEITNLLSATTIQVELEYNSVYILLKEQRDTKQGDNHR